MHGRLIELEDHVLPHLNMDNTEEIQLSSGLTLIIKIKKHFVPFLSMAGASHLHL